MKINFDSNANVIIVDLFIQHNSKKTKIRMALDTGATYTMIPWEVAETLCLEPELSKERIEMITASGIEKVPIVKLSVAKVGDSEVENLKSIVHDLPQKSYVDGLLGLSFLKNFNLHINFKDGCLELADKI